VKFCRFQANQIDRSKPDLTAGFTYERKKTKPNFEKMWNAQHLRVIFLKETMNYFFLFNVPNKNSIPQQFNDPMG
jgi:hypothetical protein